MNYCPFGKQFGITCNRFKHICIPGRSNLWTGSGGVQGYAYKVPFNSHLRIYFPFFLRERKEGGREGEREMSL